jgi:hypothetical protein
MYTLFSLCLLVSVLFLFLTVSCGDDESSPVSPDKKSSNCIHYDNYLHIAGTYDTPGTALGAAVSGNYAFIADGTSGLQVADISTPALPTLSGSIDTPGWAYGVTVSDDYVYIADTLSGLHVVKRQCQP